MVERHPLALDVLLGHYAAMVGPCCRHQQNILEVLATDHLIIAIYSHERTDPPIEQIACLLPDFPDHRLLDGLVRPDFATGQTPVALEGVLLPPDHEDVIAAQHGRRYSLGEVPAH